MDIYLVGGAVRDALLGLPVHERDYVVVGATPQQLLAQGFVPVGNDFPVFLHPESKEEYALARTERKAGFGYTGFECYAAPDVSLNDDLLRRDLTINAIAQSNDGTLHDPYHGQQDIEQRLLRHVSPAFAEDPLRVLRVARFAARFANLGFRIAEDTQLLMRNMVAAGELQHLAAERVWLETRKALLTPSPAVYFQVLHEVGALAVILRAPQLPSSLILTNLKQLTCPSIPANNAAALPANNASAVAERFVLAAFDIRQAYENAGLTPPSVATALKVPNKLAHAATESEALVTLLKQRQLNAADILSVLKRTDAFRRPEQYNLLLRCVLLILAPLPRIKAADVQALTKALAELNKIDVSKIIAAGYQQQEIGIALQAQRLSALEQLLIEEQRTTK